MGILKVFDKFRAKSGAAESGNGGEAGKRMKKVRSIVRVSSKKPVHLPLVKQESPNYMKPTTSYDKRKEGKNRVGIDSSAPAVMAKSARVSPAARVLVKNSSLKKIRVSAKKNAGKGLESKAPKPVDQEKHEAASATACHYSYCSLHGHKLKRILSQKVQKTMDLRGYSSIEKKGGKEIELVEDVVNELFIEIHTKLQEKRTVRQREWGEQRSKEGIQIENGIAGMLQDSCSVASSEDCGDKNSELSMEEIQVINQFLEYIKKEYQEEAEIEATFANGFERENRNLQPYVHHLPHSPHGSEPKNVEAESVDFAPENHSKDGAFLPQQLNPDSSHGMEIDLNNRPKVKHTRSRSRSTKNREGVKLFNPRPPRLLEQKAEPEQEQINLKHQTVEERKAAEEWMIDYALRKALRRVTSVRKQKVPQLVAAFETVLPQKF